jgi:hypothetical protein
VGCRACACCSIPADGVYRAVILRVDGWAHFRAAKADAVRQLSDGGFDLCSIGRWAAYGRFAADDRSQPDDLQDLPVECAPRVVAADAGAMALVAGVQAALQRTRDLTVEQMGWRPNRPLTVMVISDPAVAVSLYQRFVEPGAHAAYLAQAGRSFHVRGSNFGGLILLNVTRTQEMEAIVRFIAHEYTHVAQHGIGNSNDFFPKWIREGQAVYQEVRNGSGVSDVRYADIALKAQRDGTALRLGDISRSQDWDARDGTPEGTNANYSRAYVATAYLIERYGFDATVQLYRENRNGSLDQFNVLLARLTGLDLDGLDQAVGIWLLTMPRATAADADGRYHLDVSLVPGRLHLAGTVTIDRELTCGSGRVLRAGAMYTFAPRITAAGAFADTVTFRDSPATATLEGSLTEGADLTGTFRYVNPMTQCDTGALPFRARVA